MKAIERIEKRYIHDDALKNLTMAQARHVIDALSLCVYADLSLDIDEEFAFESLVFTLPCNWNEIVELEQYAVMSCKTAALLNDQAAINEHIESITSAIPSSVRSQVFSMLIAISAADQHINLDEARLLSEFAKGFELNEEAAHAIYDETIDALGLVEQ